MAAPVIRNTTVASNTGGSLAVTKPAGLVVGDLLIVWQVADNDAALGSLGAPAGWTTLGSEAGVASGHPYQKVWTKVATSTETAASTFTFTNSDAGIHNSVVCMAIQTGTYDSGTPTTSVSFNNNGTTASTSHVAPSVTGVVDGLLLTSHACDAGGAANPSYTAPGGMTERGDTSSGASAFTVLEVCSLELASTAATGTKTATCTANRPWKGSTLIVNPATTPPPSPAVWNTTSASNSGGSLAVTKPSGIIVGDLLIAWHAADNDGSLGAMGAPAGWTLLGSEAGTTGGHPYEKVWTKVATSSDVSASSFTFTNSASGIHNSCVVMAIEAGTYDTATPTGSVTFNNGGTGSSTSHVAPSLTGVTNGLLCTSHGCDAGGGGGSYTAPSGMTERADTTQSGGSGYTALSVATVPLTSTAATGTKSATCTANRPWKGASLIVNPAGAATLGTRTNLATNPALKIDATGWTGPAGWARGTGLSATLPRTTGFTGTAAGDVTPPRAAVATGSQYYWAIWIKATVDQAATAQVDYYTLTSGGSFVSSSSSVAVPMAAGDTLRVVIGPHTVPATATAGTLKLAGLDGQAEITGYQVELASSFNEYFDGDSTGAVWNGTDGLSTSTVRQTRDTVTIGETFSIVETINANAKLFSDPVAVAESWSLTASSTVTDALLVRDSFLITQLEWDPTFGRNRVNAFTFDLSVTQARVTRRRVTGGNWEPVRGGVVDVVNGLMVRRVDDYEFPSGIDLDYRIEGLASAGTSSVVVQSAIVRRRSIADSVWIKFITQPALNQRLEFMGRDDIRRDARTALYQVQGRSDPVVVSDVHGSRRFSIRCKTETAAATAKLDYSLAQGLPCYLQVPESINTPSVYAVIGDYSHEPPTLRSQRSIFTIQLIEVAAPPASIVSPGATWQRVIDTYPTWEDFMAAVLTWRETAD